MAAEARVCLGGKDVIVREGDLFVVQSPGVLNFVLGLVGGGFSHIATAVTLQGRIVAVSVYTTGVFVEPLSHFDKPAYTKLAIVRPHVPRTSAQTAMLRLASMRPLQLDAQRKHLTYDSVAEFARTAFGLPAGTSDRFTCSEMTARLADAAGAWPTGHTFATRVDTAAKLIGTMERVF